MVSTPHMVAMARYLPVCIRCSSAYRSEADSIEPLARLDIAGTRPLHQRLRGLEHGPLHSA